MSNEVKLLMFAGARDIVGAAELAFPWEATGSAATLLGSLVSRFPALAPHAPSIRLAVNGSYVELGAPIRPGDTVALIPPVAGG